MRTIEINMNYAIRNGRNFKQSNTSVEVTQSTIFVSLHGNCICKIDRTTGKRYYKNCGYSTMTTRSRLNALGANVRIKDFEMIFNETGESVPAYEWSK